LINQALLWVVNSRPTITGTNFEQFKYSSKINNNFKQGFYFFGGERMKMIEGNLFSFSLGKTEVSPFQASRGGGGRREVS
jgi:hypothetical protein